jgi:nucleoside-diphosphate-sugar epimerase
MKVLITGHKGFVGSAFFRHFWHQGNAATGVDIADGRDAVEFFRKCDSSFDLVIHCAAVVGGRRMIDGSPLQLLTENLSIDAALFAWAQRARPGRIIYFASSAAYPTWLQVHPGSRLREIDLEEGTPDQTYGFSKRVGIRLAREANKAEIAATVVAPFSGYGDHQALDYPFPAFIRRIVQREAPFDIWGRGDSARDWVHIDDIVGAVLVAIDAGVTGPVNICTGRATTFDELAQMMMRRAGYSTPIRYVEDAPRGMHWRVGDPTKLHEFYVPRISLEEGIARALAAAA